MSRAACHDFTLARAHIGAVTELGKLIKVAREAKEMTQEALGEAVGVTRNAVSQWESGETTPKAWRLIKIVNLLGDRNLQELTGGKITAQDNEEKIVTALVPVTGVIHARAWLELDETEQDYGTVPVVTNRRYAGITQFALRVTDTSMNGFAKPGEYVIVACWSELAREPRDGDVLVVRRERAMTYETTLKRVRKGRNGAYELWPESDDPRYQKPMALSDGTREVKVKILGLVIGKYADVG